jgi:hypothetical protein
MITDRDIREQVGVSLQEFGGDFDIDGIVDEIQRTYGRVNIDEIESQAYWALVARHDTSAH